MRIYAGIFIIGAYIAWIAYRLLIKKDLKQNLMALSVYSSFVAVWIVIYLCILQAASS